MEILWTTTDATSFPNGGLIEWLYFKLKILCCMIAWLRGSWYWVFMTSLFQLFLLSYSFKFSRNDFFGRGYTGAKLTNNIECEIFQVLLEEAKESYPEDIVLALKSDTIEDITRNIATLTDWVRNWQPRS